MSIFFFYRSSKFGFSHRICITENAHTQAFPSLSEIELNWAVKECFLLSLMFQSELSSLNHQKFFRSSVNYGCALSMRMFHYVRMQVNPLNDTCGITSLMAANLMFEMLCVLPGVKYADMSSIVNNDLI